MSGRFWIFLVGLVAAGPALANVVWPGLVLAPRLLLWAVPAGIAIETLLLAKIRNMSLKKALGPVACVNALSALAGAVGVAVLGLAWEFTGGAVLFKLWGWGTFNGVTWLITVAVAAYLSYWLEVFFLKKLFRMALSRGERGFFLIANVVTTLIAVSSLALVQPSF